MKIGHAVMNENGAARGGAPGDGTAKEICTRAWYAPEGGWTQYIEPKDAAFGEAAARWMARICSDDRFGYDRTNRWSGLKQILRHGFGDAGKGDFDCSSLCISCCILAGLTLPQKGSTRDIAKRLAQTGAFNVYGAKDPRTKGPALAVKGGMWCTPGRHVVMAIENGADARLVDARLADSAEKGAEGAEDEQMKDSVPAAKGGSVGSFASVESGTGVRSEKPPVGTLFTLGSVRVRETPVSGRTVRILRRGERVPFFGQDPETGWCRLKEGWVTGNGRYICFEERRTE